MNNLFRDRGDLCLIIRNMDLDNNFALNNLLIKDVVRQEDQVRVQPSEFVMRHGGS